MTKENLCIASGCLGFCCQDIDLEITGPERREIFPTAQKVLSIKKLARIKEEQEVGLFYLAGYERPGLEGLDFCLLTINGPCPNITLEGNCSKHTIREHAAINFQFGSEDCNSIRKEHGLAPIQLMP